jgi:hypothetical protein
MSIGLTFFLLHFDFADGTGPVPAMSFQRCLSKSYVPDNFTLFRFTILSLNTGTISTV